MVWPNNPHWKALADGDQFEINGRLYVLQVVECGDLIMPTGRLVVCDPFAAMRQRGNATVSIPPGKYPVKVTLADVSGVGDGSHIREAYASLILSDHPEVERRVLTPSRDGETASHLDPGEFFGYGVDAGTACFVDAGALEYGMPDELTWFDELFENDSPTSWFNRMDDPDHIREGIANIPLPLATNGSTLVLFHSGWGDGHFPVIGGYDASSDLVAVHTDFFVIPASEDADATSEKK